MAVLSGGELASHVGRLVREARNTIGWSQLELGARARVPQSTISRLERGVHSGLDFDDLQRIAKAMGGRFGVTLNVPFVGERSRQRDRVHATCIAYVVRHLRRAGWRAESEVEIQGAAGPGWIDVLAWHPETGALLVIEIKTEIRDIGQVQRTLAWYEHGAWRAARRLGWSPRHVRGALIALDSADVAATLRANREIVDQSFPARAAALSGYVDAPTFRAPSVRAVALVDPRSRKRVWLRATPLDGRRVPPAYRDYADIARRLGA